MAMVYFKSSDGVLVTMDSESTIGISKSNTVASSSVMSTREVADEVIEGNLTISVTGKVTYSKTPAQEGNPTPDQWVDLIEKSISEKLRFTLYSVKHVSGKPLLKDYPNLVIADYGYTVDRFEDTLTVKVTFREIFVSSAAAKTSLPPKKSKAASSEVPDVTTGGGGTSKEVSEEKRDSMLVQFIGVSGLLSPIDQNNEDDQ